MKKYLSFILIIAFLFCCAGCSKGVTQEEYDKVKTDFEELQNEYEELKKDYENLELLENAQPPINGLEKYKLDLICYEPGMYKVGRDIPAGQYMLKGYGLFGSFRLASSADMKDENILSSDLFTINSIVTANEGEFLKIESALAIPMNEWYNKYKIIPPDTGSCMLIVGYDIPAGKYKLTPSRLETDKIYGQYAICNFSRYDETFDSVYVKDITYITVKEGQYLRLEDCLIEEY